MNIEGLRLFREDLCNLINMISTDDNHRRLTLVEDERNLPIGDL